MPVFKFLNLRQFSHCLLACFSLFCFSCTTNDQKNEWSIYGGSKERNQYSALDLIDTSNVKNLQQAWIYHTKDAEPGSQIQANPLIVDGVLYGVSAKLKLFAADAQTGKELWVFNPLDSMIVDLQGRKSEGMNACRGIALYKLKNKALKNKLREKLDLIEKNNLILIIFLWYLYTKFNFI